MSIYKLTEAGYTPTENLHQLSKWPLCKSLMNCLLMAAIEHWSNPNKDAISGSALRAISALREALRALGRLARGMSERPRTRWGKIQSPTPAACRVQNGVEWQHFAARRFLGTYSLFGKVSRAFFFFSLIWNLALQRKELCTESVSNVFSQTFCLASTFQSPIQWVPLEKSCSFQILVNTTKSKKVQHA